MKAAPLIIIAVGLAIGYRANVWNIGAEGQYIVGAVAGTGVGLATNGDDRLVDHAADDAGGRRRAGRPMRRCRRSCRRGSGSTRS